MIVYGLKSCDTTRAALQALAAAGLAPVLVDLRQTPLDAAALDWLLGALGPKLMNRASTTWRGLAEAERAADPAALMLRHPTLIKRPVIEAGGRLTIGWGPQVRAMWLGTGG